MLLMIGCAAHNRDGWAQCYVAAAKKVSNKKKKMPSQIMDPKK